MTASSNGDAAVPTAHNSWTPPKLQPSLLGPVGCVGRERHFPVLMTRLVSTAAATETLGPEDAIRKELESPNSFDGEEKTSHKSLPKV